MLGTKISEERKKREFNRRNLEIAKQLLDGLPNQMESLISKNKDQMVCNEHTRKSSLFQEEE